MPTSCPACLVFWSSFFEKGIKTTLSSLSQYHLAYRPNVSEKDATRSFAHTFKLTCFFFHVCLFVFFKFLGKLCKYRKTTNITFETVLSESVDVKRQAHCTFFLSVSPCNRRHSKSFLNSSSPKKACSWPTATDTITADVTSILA